MSENPLERQTQDYSDRFDRGDCRNNTPDEESIAQAYRQIRRQLKQYPVSMRELSNLSAVLKSEFQPKPLWVWRRGNRRFVRPAFAVCFALVLFCAGTFVLKSPAILPVNRADLIDRANSTPEQLSWSERFCLQRGYTIAIPKDRQANLTLREGSTISCAPGTRLAIRIDRERLIRLSAGEVTIHAARIPDSTLTVETPCFNVQVVGTTFHLKIIE